MSQPATKDDLQKGLKNLGDSLREVIAENTRDIIGHFNTSQGIQNKRLDSIDERLVRIETEMVQVNTKLDAIMSGEMLVTRKQIERLINALEAQGIKLNLTEILAA